MSLSCVEEDSFVEEVPPPIGVGPFGPDDCWTGPQLNKGYSFCETVSSRYIGFTVLNYYSTKYTYHSSEQWLDIILAGQVHLGEAVHTCPDTPLCQGDKLRYHMAAWIERSVPCTLTLVYQDEHCACILKPSGLPMIPGAGFQEHTMLSLVRKGGFPDIPRGNTWSPVHRLGRGTSGVSLWAKTKYGMQCLSLAVRERKLTKDYAAILSRAPRVDAAHIDASPCCWCVDAPIGPVPYAPMRGGTVHAASAKGRPALSAYQLVARPSHGPLALAIVRIHTGRPHQIRIHSAHAGYPLLHDPLYQCGGRPIDGGCAFPGDCGYYLHAYRLCFPSPSRDGLVHVCAAPSMGWPEWAMRALPRDPPTHWPHALDKAMNKAMDDT